MSEVEKQIPITISSITISENNMLLWLLKFDKQVYQRGLSRDSKPEPLAPEASIIPLDH